MDLTPAHTNKNTHEFLAEFWNSAGWWPYLPGLNPLDFSIRSILQAKVQAMPHSNLVALHMSIAAE
jgi:hypothetical protein